MSHRRAENPTKSLPASIDEVQVRGKIIGDVALLDFYLSIILSMYFSPNERALQFHLMIGDKMTFSRKINLLAEVCKGKSFKSSEVVVYLRRIAKIRNHLAHVHFYDRRQKVFKDKEIVKLLDNWPSNYQKEHTAAKLRLWRLGRTKLFTKFQGKDYCPLKGYVA